jgi:hypothetical protein
VRPLVGPIAVPVLHAAVLGAGVVTPPVLRDRVHGWIAVAAR